MAGRIAAVGGIASGREELDWVTFVPSSRTLEPGPAGSAPVGR